MMNEDLWPDEIDNGCNFECFAGNPSHLCQDCAETYLDPIRDSDDVMFEVGCLITRVKNLKWELDAAVEYIEHLESGGETVDEYINSHRKGDAQ